MATVRAFGWRFATCALALALPVQAMAFQGALPIPLSSTASSAVGAFYISRQGSPMWFGPAAAGAPEKLAQILRRAPLDGLASGPRLADQVEAAITRARSDPAAVAEAEKILSAAWLLYVEEIRSPSRAMMYGDALVRPGVPRPALVLQQAAGADSLVRHLDQVSSVNPVYAALRDTAAADPALAGGPDAARVMANLDRVRALPAHGRFVLVDAAAAKLWMYEDGRPVDSMKVIVGKRSYATPMIASVIHYATFNPYWHVPDNLARSTIAPNVVRQGKRYLETRGYEVVSAWSDSAQVLSPDDVDWKAVAAGRESVKVRQLPGRDNSMGKMKFPFPNGEGIYLHDTPSKDLFAKAQRTLSNGCIRLEDAARLGRWLMEGAALPSPSDPEQHVRLPEPVPIFVTYITAHPEAGTIAFTDDVYGRDAAAAARIAAVR